MTTEEAVTAHEGGGFNPPDPTLKGGPDYGRFIDALRTLQDRARAALPPDEVITNLANQLEAMNELLDPYEVSEWDSPSGRRTDLPLRGNILLVPMTIDSFDNGVLTGTATFGRYHLGRNGAVHGGCLGLLFDTIIGTGTMLLTDLRKLRTAYLNINYRKVTPIEKELQFDCTLDRVEGRKVYLTSRLLDGDDVLAEADALFVKLNPGQP
ncbi:MULTISPECIES: PaaI family thioesterase [Mycobacteroides]|jgi:acyl-coenzyme A thioesterase PaaI-like protein|uniref:Acyl-coenzyme A thioesterase THEM4 n=1 Tax=Mycobacteroides chelonae TaxID=1774 RepID=A0A1S1L1F7_MYCCH|nr:MULTISPECIES: PaaI family thioesterase [Mycobacteroides]AYM42599.1 PaaI family thioesterase [[Mycobacterium] chelonae subsp. gwanakae]KRQ25949.1 thioesterase [Mycobacteroides sp. H003]KRQ35074.1 thioesterase [Mycobacteroides sp. H092]KRQ39277.1 thioesterase [Mycobacteroides sp. H101]KRQ48654.1 thioesterase [Mycobacteroides sp. H063]